MVTRRSMLKSVCMRVSVTAVHSLPVNTSDNLNFSLSFVMCPLYNITFMKFLSVNSRLWYIQDKYLTVGTYEHHMSYAWLS